MNNLNSIRYTTKMDCSTINDDLKTIVKLYASNGGYGLTENYFKNISSYPLLVGNDCFSRRKNRLKLTIDDPIEYDLSIVVFVSDKLYANYRETLDEVCDWAELLFLKEPSPSSPVFFSTRLFQLFKSDPNFIINWIDFRTDVYSHDTNPPLNIVIKHLCLAHDNEKHEPVLMMFLCDLLKLGELEKGFVRPFLLKYSKTYKFYEQNYINLVEGNFFEGEYESIYSTILSGITIVNNITSKIHGFKLYKSDERTIFLRSIVYPTKYNYEDYLFDVAILLVDNINVGGLRDYLWDRRGDYSKTSVGKTMMTNNKKIFEKKTLFEEIRSISLLELLISEYKSRSEIIRFIKKEIWEKRSKIAHNSNSPDRYDASYYRKQDELTMKVYKVIFGLIDYLDPNRNICGNIDIYKNYITQYSIKGYVSDYCGLNCIDI